MSRFNCSVSTSPLQPPNEASNASRSAALTCRRRGRGLAFTTGFTTASSTPSFSTTTVSWSRATRSNTPATSEASSRNSMRRTSAAIALLSRKGWNNDARYGGTRITTSPAGGLLDRAHGVGEGGRELGGPQGGDGDLLEARGGQRELPRLAARDQYPNVLVELAANDPDWFDQVRIVGNDDGRVILVLEGVEEEVGRQVDVGTLLFCVEDVDEPGESSHRRGERASLGLRQEGAVVNGDVGQRL